MSNGKPNGKTIPAIADVAEVLAAVNERMNEGMSREAELKARVLAWNPAEDITAYELARALMVLLVGFSGGDAFEVLEKQGAEVKRHFTEPPANEAN